MLAAENLFLRNRLTAAQIEDNEEDMFNLRRKFIISLKGVLPSVKIIKLKKAEEDFGRKLLQQYKDKGAKK